MKRKPTMRDIAQQAGVSQTTVSFVLNNNKSVSIHEDTRRSVFAAAERLGYASPGRRRRPPRAPVIGLLIDEIATSTLMADLVEGVTERAARHGYSVPTILTRGSDSAAEAALRSWQSAELLGVIHATVVTGPTVLPRAFAGSHSILLNCHADSEDFASILPGETLGGLTATSHLIDRGCRDILHLTGEDWLEAVVQRREGFRIGLESAGIAGAGDRTIHASLTQDAGYRMMQQVLADRPVPDGIFCGSDWVAQGVYQALAEAGIRPGRDVKIVGYDNQFFAAGMTPPLTTINLPYREMGQLAVSLLLDSKEIAGREFRLPCNLVTRNSTAG